MFSRRLVWDRTQNALAALEQARHRAGLPITDLTVSNPTEIGLAYPAEAIRQALGTPEVTRYQPAPLGLLSAREAVAADYARRGITVDTARTLLTASSSESYALLFKLLCDPGDSVLVPEPSYPLFEYLARLEGVHPVPYSLGYEGGWHLEASSVQAAIAAAGRMGPPRAVVVVNPNNPTGSFIKHSELERLASLCGQNDLALIADEVFADYPMTWFERTDAQRPAPEKRVTCAAVAPAAHAALTFSLGGLSKSCGLPQLKLGWIVGGGAPALLDAAWARLELIADTYLSANTPVQLGAAQLLAAGQTIRAQIRARVETNRAQLARLLPPSSPCTLLRAEGGWSAILRVPAVSSDEAWAMTLLREDGILVQPGYFFDMPVGGAYLVISLLPPTAAFAQAAAALIARCSSGQGGHAHSLDSAGGDV